MKLKIHGQKRCGTNLVEFLLREAGHTVFVNEFGWKHGPVDSEIRSHVDKVVICMRNPAAWLVGNRKHDAEVTWPEERWATLEEWAFREDAYLDWAHNCWEDDYVLLDTMTLITNPERAFELLHDEVGFPELRETPNKKMAMNGFPMPKVDFDHSYYTHQKYLDELQPGDWGEIQKQLDAYWPTLGARWQGWFDQVRRDV